MVVVSLVVPTTTGPTSINTIQGTSFSIRPPFGHVPPLSALESLLTVIQSYFGKVGMRHFHYMQNPHWRPTINIDKLWSLVPTAEKEGLTEDSEVVPVIDTLKHGYAKVLGNGKIPKLPFILKTRYVSSIAE